VVLIVDDTAADRKRVAALLRADGDFEVEFAKSGTEALDRIDVRLPDIIVTDLTLGDMDGLDFVTKAKGKDPRLPIILMTTRGTEEIALQALHHGAASYVPKPLLASALTMTLRDVLSASTRAGGHARLLNYLTRDECSFTLASDPDLIPCMVSYLQHRFIETGATEECDRVHIAVGLEEALVNALYHGNLELSSHLRDEEPEKYERLVKERSRKPPYCQRRIFVDAKLSREALVFVVRDEGPGFDPKLLPDPTEPANLERVSGRGVFLMRTFLDEVFYNSSGNQVTLIKHRVPKISRAHVESA
jgi:CheY-like chemotaxis protein/anti-sigma regulatory factor (Ser/Thr protein kinase)